MAREDHVEFQGTVIDAFAGSKFKVELENPQKSIIECTLSGKLRINMIRILKGDKVTVSISPYDLTKGIITWRK